MEPTSIIYATSAKRHLFMAALSALFVAFGILIAQEIGPSTYQIAFIIIPVMTGALNLVGNFVQKLAFTDHEVIYQSLGNRWSILREDIEDWKLIRNKGQHHAMLQVRHKNGQVFVVSDMSALSVQDDQTFAKQFARWLRRETLPKR